MAGYSHLNALYSGFGFAKALIFGEYAVMNGAPALAAALSARAKLALAFPKSPASIKSPSQFETKLLALLHHPVSLSNDFAVDSDCSIDTHDFFDENGIKLGIGSSAAAVTALIDAQIQAAEANGAPAIHGYDAIKAAICAHRFIQGGRGSGIDVIASALGGCIIASGCPHTPIIQRVLPDHIPPFSILATHSQAPTVSFIKAAENPVSPALFHTVMHDLNQIDNELAVAVSMKKHNQFLYLIKKTIPCLERLGIAIGAQIIPNNFRSLFEFAQKFNVLIKPSGAGGGDIYIALADDKKQIDDCINALPNAFKLSQLSLSIAPERNFHGMDLLSENT